MGRSATLVLLLVAGALLVPPVHVGAEPSLLPTYILQFTHPLTPAERAELLAVGVVPEELKVIDGALAPLTAGQLGAVRAKPFVERVDPEERIELHVDRSKALVRAPLSATRGSGPAGAGVTVAVVDSGLDATHPDFSGRVLNNLLWVQDEWRAGGVDRDGHGTHVAGIVAGSGAQAEGRLAGFAPEAKIDFLGFGDQFTTTVALRAFDWILAHKDADDIRVVQNSWGRADGKRAYDPGDALIRASDRLVSAGIVVVFSASNHGAEGSETIALEAQNPNVITVGAVDDAAVPAKFSSRGPVREKDGTLASWIKPDVVADGVGILSARSAQTTGDVQTPFASLPSLASGGAFYREMQGTSQAAPAVAGAIALILAENPDLTPRDIRRIVLESAIDLGEPGPDDATGFGLMDLTDALALARGAVPDRRNVIVAGGEDTFSARGQVYAVQGAAVQTDPSPSVRQDGTIESDFPVKPGGQRVAFDLSWTGSGRMSVYLHDGTKLIGPFTKSAREGDRQVIHGVADTPTEGVWSLLAKPSNSANLEYASTVHVAVKECPTCIAVVDPAYLDAGPSTSTLDQARYFAEDAVYQMQAFVQNALAGGPEATYAVVGAGLIGVAFCLRLLRG